MLSLIALSLLADPAAAADRGLTLGLAGGLFWYNERDNLQDTWTVVPRVGYQLSPLFTVEADPGLMQGLTDLDRTYYAFTPRANLLVHPFNEWRVQPFAAAGPGMLYRNVPSFEFEDIDSGVQQADRNYQNPDLDFLVNAGPGLMVPIGERFNLRTDLRYALTLGNEAYSKEDATNPNADRFSDWEWTLGFMLRPGDRVLDADADGLVDAEDQCVDEAEDFDGYMDTDGCPDFDNDGDSIADASDACPDEAEDMDGWEDDEGCPDPDNDGDGFADAADTCPDVAGAETGAGCPDQDGDGVLDVSDACPSEYGEGDDGCPTQVVVDEDKGQIVILDKVYFDSASATIQDRSFSLLDEVARVIEKYPALALIEVSGHTDSQGDNGFNVQLSQSRAESVKGYLMDKGIDAARLAAKGYGSETPLGANETEEGRSQNRRVEFNILDGEEERVRSR